MKTNHHYYNNRLQGYKKCAGLRCENKAKIMLKVKFINKNGYFCEQCASDLIKSELVENLGAEA